jgi:hypothetical protein
MKQNAPEVARVCDWIYAATNQDDEARRARSAPPGVWIESSGSDGGLKCSPLLLRERIFPHRLDAAAEGLAAINYPGADKIVATQRIIGSKSSARFTTFKPKPPCFR